MKLIVVAKSNTECTVIIPKQNSYEQLTGSIASICLDIAEFIENADDIYEVKVVADGYGFWYMQRLQDKHHLVVQELENIDCMNSK